MFEPSVPDRAQYMPHRQGSYVRHPLRRLRVVGAPNGSPANIDAPKLPTAPPSADQPLSMTVAGAASVPVTAAALAGAWTLCFGRFGCPDDETRGGFAHVERNRLTGGNAHFTFDGWWKLRGTELNAVLLIVQHGADRTLAPLFGTNQNEYRADCIAEVLTRNLIEGRIRRPGFPDARLMMRRLPRRPR
jgi:hypothetical protein